MIQELAPWFNRARTMIVEETQLVWKSLVKGRLSLLEHLSRILFFQKYNRLHQPEMQLVNLTILARIDLIR